MSGIRRFLVCVFLWISLFSSISYSTTNIGPVTSYDPDTYTSSPFFPVGWYTYGPVGVATVTEISETGSNTILFAGCWDQDWWHYEYVGAALDRANELGMKIVVGFDGSMLVGVNYAVPSTYLHLRRWIIGFRNKPALLGWQLGDENGGPLTAQMVQDSARAIKDLDSHHQIWQVFAIDHTESVTTDYMINSDVYSYDFYQYFDTLNGSYYTPLFGGSDGLLNNQVIRMGWAASHGWEGNVNVTQGIGADRGTGIDIFRFPNYEEYRWNVFSAIAGAKMRGTMNWIYYYGENYYSDPAMFTTWRENVNKPVNLEQRAMQNALETGWDVGTLSSNLDDLVEIVPGVYRVYSKASYILLHDSVAQVYYLVVTNNTFDTQTLNLSLSNLPLPLSSLNALLPKESRQITMTSPTCGSYLLTDILANHDVHIYTLYSNPIDGDANLSSVVDFYDFAILASNWMESPTQDSWCFGDFNGDHVVDFNDLSLMVQNWLEGSGI